MVSKQRPQHLITANEVEARNAEAGASSCHLHMNSRPSFAGLGVSVAIGGIAALIAILKVTGFVNVQKGTAMAFAGFGVLGTLVIAVLIYRVMRQRS